MKAFFYSSLLSSFFSSVFGAGAAAAAFFAFFLRGFFLYFNIKLAADITKSITTRVTITRQSLRTLTTSAKNSLNFIYKLSDGNINN